MKNQLRFKLLFLSLFLTASVYSDDIVIDQTEGLGYVIRLHEANASSKLELLGSGNESGHQVLIESSDGQITLDTTKLNGKPESLFGTYGQSFSQNDITIRTGIISFQNNIPVVVLEVSSTSKEPRTIRPVIIFDIPEKDQFPKIFADTIQIENETEITPKKGNLRIISENGKGIAFFLKDQDRLNYAESIVFSNLKRLEFGFKVQPIQEGRNLSFLPYSVLDRGLAFKFSETILLPESKKYFIIPILSDTDSISALQKSIDTSLANFQANLPKDQKPVLEDERIKLVKRINEIIKKLNEAYTNSNLTIIERERLLDELQKLMQSLK